ncbi:MAG: hypothetical protein IJ088_04095 [Clostridia bacterium]|nr:hypothetical protein [Clostridia bacterium]
MGVILGIIFGIAAFVIIALPFVMVWDILKSIYASLVINYPFLGAHPAVMVLALLSVLFLITILVGIGDMLLCRLRVKMDSYQKLREENRRLVRTLEAADRREKELARQEEEIGEQASQAFYRNRTAMEQNLRFHERTLQRNRLCVLLASMGSAEASKLVVRVNGEDVRKQEKELLDSFEKVKERFAQ